MPAVPAAKIPRRGLEQQHARTRLARRDRRAESRVAAAGDEDVRNEVPQFRPGEGASRMSSDVSGHVTRS